jgi:hypothetical protein
MVRGCCAKPVARIIKVGNFEAGLVGLDESLRNVYVSAIADEEEIRRDLLTWIKEFGNYIVPSREHDYQDARLREYKIFVRKAETEQKKEHTGS